MLEVINQVLPIITALVVGFLAFLSLKNKNLIHDELRIFKEDLMKEINTAMDLKLANHKIEELTEKKSHPIKIVRNKK